MVTTSSRVASLRSLTMNWSVDDNLDDNRDDNYSLYYGNHSPKSLLSCLVTAPARSWQAWGSGVHEAVR